MAELVASRKAAGEESICTCDYTGMLIAGPYQEIDDSIVDTKVSERFETLQELIRSVRALRAECGIGPEVKLNVALVITQGSSAEVCKEKIDIIKLLAGIGDIEFVENKIDGAIGTVGNGFEAFIKIDGSVNVDQLKTRFTKELTTEKAFIAKVDAKLAGKFAQNAPKEVVEAEKEKRANAARRVEKLESYLQNL